MKEKNIQNNSIRNFPEHIRNLPRRQFMRRIIGSASIIAALPYISCSGKNTSFKTLEETAGKLSKTDFGDERFWKIVKEQFLIRKNLIMMNTANLCPSPNMVQETVLEYTRDEDADASFTNREKFKNLLESTHKALAEYLGASPDEIVITRNTSESNNMVINGITLKQNDEVVIWNQNHPTNNLAWDVRAERYGFSVKRVKTPPLPESGDDMVKPFRDALSNRTKVLAFSHVSNISGTALPAKELCQMARDNGILTLIDGAQTFGANVVNLNDIGCDFYTGSAHKWFCGPREVGILYIRSDRIANLHPTIVGAHWENSEKTASKKFEAIGQRDDARLAAMGETVKFQNTIGKSRVEARIFALAEAVKSELKKKIRNIKFFTPLEPEFSSGIVVFTAPGIDLSKALNTLYHKHNIGCAVMSGDFTGIRLSPNINNSMEEVDKAVTRVASLL